eukprot:Clim_evm218s157 gene=Clim_evmTU218s157
MPNITADWRPKVAYFYDSEVGNYYYGQGHPMKPHRIRMAHNLILNYGLYKKMEIFRPHRGTFTDMTRFHSDSYVEFLRRIMPDIQEENRADMQRYNVGEDCPVFDGLYEFCQISAGGSIGGAVKLNQGTSDIAINWAGGLHHAKKSEASGFCYINDIVLAILELLKYHQRVLYIDIDIHHGDGVEEAFYTTDRVMTVSFHKYGEYFPGTGDIRDIGAKKGKHYAVNFPMRDGIDDAAYRDVFQPLMKRIMEWYDPGAIVLQCGADSLAGDRLGCFNLSIDGHADCVRYMKSFKKPLLLLGGGGYTIRNVARCWTYETAIALDTQVSIDVPFNEYFEYYGPEYKLYVPPSNMENRNTPDYLHKTLAKLIDGLRNVAHVPSVQMHEMNAPEARVSGPAERDPDESGDKGNDGRIACDEELSDSDDENQARNQQNHGEGKVSIMQGDKGETDPVPAPTTDNKEAYKLDKGDVNEDLAAMGNGKPKDGMDVDSKPEA